jgi:uncharacterized protein YndB with AHSA1/START domain
LVDAVHFRLGATPLFTLPDEEDEAVGMAEFDCQVLAIEPNKTLSYTWAAYGLESVVTWTLTATSTGTNLRMQQSGFRPDQPQNYQGAKYGWQKFFANLERVLARIA